MMTAEDNEDSSLSGDTKRQVTAKVVGMLEESLDSQVLSDASSDLEEAEQPVELFGSLYKKRSLSEKQNGAKLFKSFVDRGPQRQLQPTCFEHKAL